MHPTASAVALMLPAQPLLAVPTVTRAYAHAAALPSQPHAQGGCRCATLPSQSAFLASMAAIRDGTFTVLHDAHGRPIYDCINDQQFVPGRLHSAGCFWEEAIKVAQIEPTHARLLQDILRRGVSPADFYVPLAREAMHALPGFVSYPDLRSRHALHRLLPSIYQRNHPLPDAVPGLPAPQDFLRAEVAAMLAVGAVKRVDKRPYIVQPISVATNAAGTKQRLIYDCRALNEFQQSPPMRYPRLTDLVRWADEGSDQLLASLDAKSAYYGLLVQAGWEEAFGFWWEGQFYVYTVMCFGWRNGPFCYQSLMDVLNAAMRVWLCGIVYAITYIDDTGLLARAAAMLRVLWAFTRAFVLAGITLSSAKSLLKGVRSLLMLGLISCLDKRGFIIPEEKVVRLQRELAALRTAAEAGQRVPVKQLQRLCGLLISLSPALPTALLLLRPLFALFADAVADHLHTVSVSGREARAAIDGLLGFQRWSDLQRWPSDSHVHVLCAASDASTDGLGLVLTDPLQDVRWDFSMPVAAPGLHHIMVEEGDALLEFLLRHGHLLRNRRCRFLIDNEGTRVSNAGKGSRHLPLNTVSLRTLQLLMELGVVATFDRITTLDNTRPDALSRLHLPAGTAPSLTRHRVTPLDVTQGVAYGLPPPSDHVVPALAVPRSVVRALEKRWGTCFTLDMAASPLDARVGRFVGRFNYLPRFPRCGQVATDLFAVAPGPEEFVFVNPAWRLVAPVWAHLKAVRAAGVCLLPDLPRAVWFSAVLADALPRDIVIVAERGDHLHEWVNAAPGASPPAALRERLLAVHFDFRRLLGPRPAPSLPAPTRTPAAAVPTRGRRVHWAPGGALQ